MSFFFFSDGVLSGFGATYSAGIQLISTFNKVIFYTELSYLLFVHFIYVEQSILIFYPIPRIFFFIISIKFFSRSLAPWRLQVGYKYEYLIHQRYIICYSPSLEKRPHSDCDNINLSLCKKIAFGETECFSLHILHFLHYDNK